MITALYAAVLALFIIRLARNVIKVRIAKKIIFGDGDDLELQTAIRIHGNALEYVPIFLILLGLLEVSYFGSIIPTLTDITYAYAGLAVLNIAGLAMLFGRYLHAVAMRTDNIPKRILSMRITFHTLTFLALANIVSFAYIAYAIFG